MRSALRHPHFRRLALLAVVAVLGVAVAVITTTAVAGDATSAAKKKKKKKKKGNRVRVVCPNPALVKTGKSKRVRCRARVRRSKRGRRGRTGVTGGPGPSHTSFIGRTFVPVTNDFIGDTGGNVVNLASVAGINVQGLCRKSHSDNNADPALDNSEEEAKVLIQSDIWTTTFGSGQGWRKNVPKGPVEFAADTNDTPSGGHPPDNPQGEGAHQFLAASTNSDWVDNSTSSRPHDEDRNTPSGWPAFRGATGFVSADFGEFKLDVSAGINVAGVGDRCAFAGIITTF
jgi:hypothetical protein